MHAQQRQSADTPPLKIQRRISLAGTNLFTLKIGAHSSDPRLLAHEDRAVAATEGNAERGSGVCWWVRSIASRHRWEPGNPAREHFSQRYPVEWPVCLGTPRGAIRAEALDVSADGMFVRPLHPVSLEAQLTFSAVVTGCDGRSAVRRRMSCGQFERWRCSPRSGRGRLRAWASAPLRRGGCPS